MSDSDSADSSGESSERSTNSSSTDDKRSHFVFGGSLEPYQGEPLAEKNESVDGQSSDSDEDTDELDEDGISPSELEKRFKREIPVEEWCKCGQCNVDMLVGVREYRCCFEIVEATGKYLFEGLDVGCIVNHSDFGPLTHRAVLLLAGPLLRNKKGKYYKKHSGTGSVENRFLRAVSYRWLARWLFGLLGWENTRPLAACVYHNIRKRYFTGDSQGYVSGKERADGED